MFTIVVLILALLCFLAAASGVTRPNWPWQPLGLALVTFALLIGAWTI